MEDHPLPVTSPARGPAKAAARSYLPAFLVAVWALAAAGLAFLSPFEDVELRTLDLQFKALRPMPVPPAADRVAVVGIDSRSIASISEPVGLWHGYLAKYLEALAKAEPAVAALDIVLPDRSFEGVAPGLDRTLLRALVTTRRVYPTVLAISIQEDGRPRGLHPSFLAAAGTKPGFALWKLDGDGRIRRYEDNLGDLGERVSTLVGEVARHLELKPRSGYVDFALGDGFDYIPFIDVLQASERGDVDFLRKRFGDKAVLLGMVLPFTDAVRVPVPIARWDVPENDTPGVLIHAQALRTMLAGRMVQRFSPFDIALVTLFAAALAFFATTPVRAGLLAGALAIALPAASVALLRDARFMPIAWPLFAGLFAVGLRQGIDIAARLGERRRLRNSFSGYVSPAVMKQILDGRIRPEAGGNQTFICALFSDVRGYTTISEGMSPEMVLTFFNRYFDRMVEVVHEHEGAVISFMGDGMMAVFGAPQPLDNPCEAGYRAGLGMLKRLEELNREFVAEGLPSIAIGVGIHAGDAVVGHVGSKTRHDYTAIGDAINVASRLESASKEAGYTLICSTQVVERVADRAGLTHLGPMSLKGHTPVDCWGAVPVVKSAPAGAENSRVAATVAVRS